eukprot:UN06768
MAMNILKPNEREPGSYLPASFSEKYSATIPFIDGVYLEQETLINFKVPEITNALYLGNTATFYHHHHQSSNSTSNNNQQNNSNQNNNINTNNNNAQQNNNNNNNNINTNNNQQTQLNINNALNNGPTPSITPRFMSHASNSRFGTPVVEYGRSRAGTNGNLADLQLGSPALDLIENTNNTQNNNNNNNSNNTPHTLTQSPQLRFQQTSPFAVSDR